MKVKDILELENAVGRDKKSAYIIREGEWLHAYEWSAYLIHHIIGEEKQRLKPTKRQMSLIGDGLIVVGFKESSVEKYLGASKDQIEKEKEVSCVKFEIPDDFSEQECDDLLTAWKASYEYSETKRKNNPDEKKCTKEEILEEVRNFNVARHTLIESVDFITRVKDKINNICS